MLLPHPRPAILQGSNPQAIVRHLPKCFDNVHNLEFAKDEAGAPTKMAVGMYSGEGEYVPFAAPCSCDGPVEVRAWAGLGPGASRGAGKAAVVWEVGR